MRMDCKFLLFQVLITLSPPLPRPYLPQRRQQNLKVIDGSSE